MKTENKENTSSQDILKNNMAVLFAEKSEERQASEKQFATWALQLNEFLFASNHDFAHALTLAKIVSGIQNARLSAKIHKNKNQIDRFNELSYQPIADILNQLILKPELSADTYDILTTICFLPEVADHCHAKVLLEKRMQNDTGNLHAYLRPFELASKANNNNTMQKLIQLMAVSEHSRTPLGITDNMSQLIDEFINNNPVPQSAINNMITDYQKLSGISPAKKAQLDELIPNYIPTYIKTSFKHFNDSPYKPVLKYCQTYLVALPYCRKIAQIMIQKSNSMLDKGVGHSLLIATYELERNQAGIDAAKQLNDEFRQSYECIRDLSSNQYFIDDYFNPTYQQITVHATDEFEMIIQQAELRYKMQKKQGDESATNPDTCFTDG